MELSDLLFVIFEILVVIVSGIWIKAQPRRVIWLTALGITALFLLVFGRKPNPCEMSAIKCQNGGEQPDLFLLSCGGPIIFYLLSIIFAIIDSFFRGRGDYDANLEVVQDLIKDGHYAKAEKILEGIDDPRARHWQKKIRRILEQDPGFLNHFDP